MKLPTFAVALVVIGALGACAPVVAGGPNIALPIGLQETAQIGSVVLSSASMDAEGDFPETFMEEVREELSRCMWGTAPINLRVHLDRMDRSSRAEALLDGNGRYALAGTVEFVDPGSNNRVLGRYPIQVAVEAHGRTASVLGDRQMMVSEAFGRAVCEEAFGRNPRQAGAHNATTD